MDHNIVLNFVRIGAVRQNVIFATMCFGNVANFSSVGSATLHAANMSQKTHRRHAPMV